MQHFSVFSTFILASAFTATSKRETFFLQRMVQLSLVSPALGFTVTLLHLVSSLTFPLSVSVTVSFKTLYCRSVTLFCKCCFRLRHIGEWPGRLSVGWRAGFPVHLSGRSSRLCSYGNGKIELDPIWTDRWQRQNYGIGERYFLRKLRILTDERNSYVLFCNGAWRYCYGSAET